MTNTQLVNRTQAFSPNRRLTRTEQLWLLGFLTIALAAIVFTRVAQADTGAAASRHVLAAHSSR